MNRTMHLTPPTMLDVDTGVDDAMSIALAVRMGVDLVGVTTVAGNVRIEPATENTLRVLSWMGRPEVPVHRGASRPIVADYHDAAAVHGSNGLGGADLPNGGEVAETNAITALLANADRYAGELVIAAVGPLTNIAMALMLDPSFASRVRRLVVMGGAFGVPGNETPHAEFNVFADPHAFAQVIAADWPELLVLGLNVTHGSRLHRGQWNRIADGLDSGAGLVRQIFHHTFVVRGWDGFYLHDPMALYAAVHPERMETERIAIATDIDGEVRGRTRVTGSGGVPIVTGLDIKAFEAEFAQRLELPWAKSRIR